MRVRVLELVALAACSCRPEPTVEPDDELPSWSREDEDEGEEADPPDPPKDAEEITFDGEEAVPAPADNVVAPPTRPPSPSMITPDVISGPRG